MSAAQVLQRAAHALAQPGIGDVVHEQIAYTGYDGKGALLTHVTTEQWAHFAADGTIDRFTLTLLANGREEEHDVLNGQGYWAYNPGQNSVLAEPPTPFKNDPAPSAGMSS